MPRRAINKRWIDLIRTERANFPKKTAAAVREVLESYEQEFREPPPEEKTVRKYIIEFDALPEDAKERYRRVYWPETFERAGDLLPWEAAPAIIELHHLYTAEQRRAHQESLEDAMENARPTLRQAMWFWRVTVAQPTAPIEDRAMLANLLNHAETLPDHEAKDARRVAELMLSGPNGRSFERMLNHHRRHAATTREAENDPA